MRTATSSSGADTLFLTDQFVDSVRALPLTTRVIAQRVYPASFDPQRPNVSVLARVIDDAAANLPLVGALRAADPAALNVYVSESFASLYDAAPGSRLELPLPGGATREAFVRGVWRDYARQHGTVAFDLADYRAASGDLRVNDLALWLAPGADPGEVQAALALLAGSPGALEFASAGELRATSLRIFDRSFAVTLWLQAVAIVIGLFGVAATFSSQVLARRKEFGALLHLGLTRSELLRLVALEGSLWSCAGALLGSVLGLLVSIVLVKVVNPQSFHWTMDLSVPWLRLGAMALAVVGCATATAWIAARAGTHGALAMQVKDDW